MSKVFVNIALSLGSFASPRLLMVRLPHTCAMCVSDSDLNNRLQRTAGGRTLLNRSVGRWLHGVTRRHEME